MQIELDSPFTTRFRGKVCLEDVHRDEAGLLISVHLLVEHTYRVVGVGPPRHLPSGAKSSPPLIRHSAYYSCLLVGEQLGPLLPALAEGTLVGLAVRVGGTATGGRMKDGREIILLRNTMVLPDTEEARVLLERDSS